MGTEQEEDSERLVIEGASAFKGRPDGKVHGRGMLGLVSAIPPAPKLPNVRGVRMLAPTIPSERPGRTDWGLDITPLGLPDEPIAFIADPADAGATDPIPPEQLAAAAAAERERTAPKRAAAQSNARSEPAPEAAPPAEDRAKRAQRAMRTTGEVLVQPVASRQAWVLLALIAATAIGVAALPAVQAALSGDSAVRSTPKAE